MEIRSTSFFKIVDIFYTDPTRPPDTDSDSDKGEVTEVNSASSLDLKCECALSAFVFFFPRFRFFLLGQVIGISGSSGDCSVRVKRACRESSARRSTAGRKLRRHVKRMYRTGRNVWTLTRFASPYRALQSRQRDRWSLDSPTSVTKICLFSILLIADSRQISIRNLPRN